MEIVACLWSSNIAAQVGICRNVGLVFSLQHLLIGGEHWNGLPVGVHVIFVPSQNHAGHAIFRSQDLHADHIILHVSLVIFVSIAQSSCRSRDLHASHAIFMMPVTGSSCQSRDLHDASHGIFMPVIQSSCRSHDLHASHTIFMPVIQSSCQSYNLHASHTIFMPVTRSSCRSRDLHAGHVIFGPVTRFPCQSHDLHTGHGIFMPVIQSSCRSRNLHSVCRSSRCDVQSVPPEFSSLYLKHISGAYQFLVHRFQGGEFPAWCPDFHRETYEEEQRGIQLSPFSLFTEKIQPRCLFPASTRFLTGFRQIRIRSFCS